MAYFSTETMSARKQWEDTLKLLSENNYLSKFYFSQENFLQQCNTLTILLDQDSLKEFKTSSHAFKGTLGTVFKQNENNLHEMLKMKQEIKMINVDFKRVIIEIFGEYLKNATLWMRIYFQGKCFIFFSGYQE